MNKQQAVEFREQWKAVAAVQLAERRRATLEDRWRQLNAIYDMAEELAISFTRQDSAAEQTVRQRWAVLKSRAT